MTNSNRGTARKSADRQGMATSAFVHARSDYAASRIRILESDFLVEGVA